MSFVSKNILLSVLYLVASCAAWSLAIPPYYASIFWPAAGIALAFVYLYGPWVLLGVFLGTLASVILSPLGHENNMEGIIVALSLSSGATLQAFTGSFFIKKALARPAKFNALRSIIVFNAIGVLSAVVASSIAALALFYVGRVELANLLVFWESWFIGDALGIFLFAPLVVIALSKNGISRQRRLAVIMPALFLFVLVIGVFFSIKNADYETNKESFENNVQLLQREMDARFDSYISVINSLQSLYLASSNVERDEFTRFVAYILEKNKGIHAIGWSPYVLDSQKDAFLAAARQEYGEEFDISGITKAGLSRDYRSYDYMPIYFVEPFESMKTVLGVDMWSNEIRRRAIEISRDHNEIVATEPLVLVSETGKTSPGFILNAPVYENGTFNPKELKGIVYGAFQYHEAVSEVIEAWRGRGIELIMKAETVGEMSVVYKSQPDFNQSDIKEGFLLEIPYVFAGQNWLLCFYLDPAFYNQNINYNIWYALVAGLVFVSITCAFLMVLTGQSASMQIMVDEKTAEVLEKNKFLNLIMDTVPDMIFVKDRALRIVQANKTFFERYAPEERKNIIGKTGLEQFPKEEREVYIINDEKAFETGFDESQESNTDYLGVVRTLLTRKERFYDEKGEPFLLGYSRDVTDIISTQRKLETILDTTADGLMTMRDNGIVETYNKACEVIFGYKAEEIIGKNVSVLIPDYQMNGSESFLDAITDKNDESAIQARQELKAKTKNGQSVPIEIFIAKVELGSRIIFSAVIRDIAEKKKAEELSKQISQIFNSSIIEFYIFDAETFEFLFVNSGAINNMGYSEAELIGHRPSEFVKEYANDRFKEMAYSLLSGEKERIEFDLRHVRKDGTSYDVVANLQLTVFNGRTAFIASMLDITDRNKVTEELKRSNKELESFAYVTSHDLKAPLRHISMSAGFFKDKFGDTLDDSSQQLLKIMIDGAARMQNMIESLLTYSRVGRSDNALEPVDLKDTLNAVKANLAEDIAQSDAEIKAKGLGVVHADRYLIIQLFQNLIQNAIKYKKDDVAPIIKIHAEDKDDMIYISIADNGIGIDSAYSEKIFQIFQRLHHENEYEGVGIGLSICQRIVEFHKGQISLDVEYKKGTKINFTLPKK